MLGKLDDLKALTIAAFVALALLATSAYANPPGTGIFVNGSEMTRPQLAALYQSTGLIPARGHYIVWNGCIAHVESGEVVCPQAAQRHGEVHEYGGRTSGGLSGGYGYNGGQGGQWFHRGSQASGGYSVGGDANGCIYTPNWSNC
ncbi:MAG: hypothetical protein HC807_00220 [Gammaproteobacteria bacterium]|nr:hypothetical protein [Gammaproteobacteria bacterium]